MIRVRCLETGIDYYFCAKTAYEAMTKMLYTLNVSADDSNAKINKTISGCHLYITHLGSTYCAKI